MGCSGDSVNQPRTKTIICHEMFYFHDSYAGHMRFYRPLRICHYGLTASSFAGQRPVK